MKKVLVLGKGASGKAAGAALEKDCCEVEFADGYDLVVASPGLRVMSELEFGVRRLKARGTKLLAVTGSKGKSSVVKAVADALNLAGVRAVACGNYGLPVSEVGDCEWAVVEVSSFQLETTNLPPDAFEAAAVLNLQEDHLDRHGSKALYHALKMKLLSMAKRGFCGFPLDGRCTPDCTAETLDDPKDDALFAGSYFDNEVLRTNGRIAVALMRVAGLDDAQVLAAFKAYVPLPHRMSVVGTFGGVRYVDDSKATSIAALVAGVEMAGRNIRLIAGGLPKGDDPKYAIAPLTGRVKKVYLIGQSGEALASVWSKAVDCEVCGTMERAVVRAAGEAEIGDTVLLSPGAASFDQFKSFGERGDVFANLVKQEGKNKT